jgi:hypothetical protein
MSPDDSNSNAIATHSLDQQIVEADSVKLDQDLGCVKPFTGSPLATG